MDLKAYYKKVRDIESSLASAHIVVVSFETPDGGKAGVLTEVARFNAATQIAENRARLATEDESTDFHMHNLEAREAHEREASLKTVQFTVVQAKDSPKNGRE
jgi:hypothetical protein